MNEPLFCYRHPQRETLLRCITCGHPICTECAVHTPTGYRCPDCQRGLEKKFITAEWYDYISAFLISSVSSLLVSLLVALISTFTGFLTWLLILLVAPSAGGSIAELVRWATRKRRAPWLFRLSAIGTVLGTLPVIVVNLVILNPFSLAFLALYLMLATPIVYGRLAGIRLN